MRFITTLLIFASAWTSILATPLPASSFQDIERRWSEGQSEAQIHNAHDIREATPAWHVDRSAEAEAEADGEFTYMTDERTMARNKQRRGVRAWLGKRTNSMALSNQMKDFVKDFMKSKGKNVDAEVDDDAPVLKPRRGLEWHFDA